MGSILSKLKAGADKEAKEESKKSFVKAVKAWLQATVAQKQQQQLDCSHYIMNQHTYDMTYI